MTCGLTSNELLFCSSVYEALKRLTLHQTVSWSSGYDFPLTIALQQVFRKGSGFDSQGNYFFVFVLFLYF